MDRDSKLLVLGDAAKHDVCTAGCGPARPRRTRAADIAPQVITQAFTSDGRAVSLFKVLQTNACAYDCAYCANRASRSCRRTAFKPEELANLFIDFHRRRYVDGLFLSSAITGSPARTMEDMLKTVELVRLKHGFKGYVHLKVLPGAPLDYVRRAVELADRCSVNMEAPTESALHRIASKKTLSSDVISRMHMIKQAAREGLLRAGQSTQLVIGAAGETDREILNAVTALYRDVGLRRVYFSAFEPVPETPLEEHAPTPPMREHRLYQVDWLLRRYDGAFAPDDIVLDAGGFLSLQLDPKVAIALRRPERFPVEVNAASHQELLRVPGIGRTSADRILRARGERGFTSLDQLRRLGVVVSRAAPFVLLDGRLQGNPRAFAERCAARGGEAQLSLPMPAW